MHRATLLNAPREVSRGGGGGSSNYNYDKIVSSTLTKAPKKSSVAHVISSESTARLHASWSGIQSGGGGGEGESTGHVFTPLPVHEFMKFKSNQTTHTCYTCHVLVVVSVTGRIISDVVSNLMGQVRTP